VDIAALLLDYGLNIQTRDALKRTVLFETLSTPDLSGANLLLVHEINIFVCNYMGNFVLHQAARRGFVQHSSLFLDQGIKSYVCIPGGMTPLHLVTKCGHYEVADLLVRELLYHDETLDFQQQGSKCYNQYYLKSLVMERL